MKLSDVSVKRPVTTLMMVFIVLILGGISLANLKLDLYPEINLPYAIVSTSYEGAGPEEVESIVSKNLEGVIATVGDLKNIQSVSSEESSMLILEFNAGTDLDIALLDVREKIDLIKSMLPDGVSSPMVIQLDPNMMPIMSFSVSQTGTELSELATWFQDTVSPRIERIEGVASVSVTGAKQKEVQITINPQRIAVYGLNVSTIAQALMMENMNAPGGVVQDGDFDLLVRTTGEFQSLEEIRDTHIMSATGVSVKLRDIATVEEAYKGEDIYSTVNGQDSLTISIQKESVANTVEVSSRINEEMDAIKELYGDVTFMTIFDQAAFINQAVNSVAVSGLIGAVLAVMVLLLFLRNVRTTTVIGVAIPISIVATFIMVYFADLTLNMISLGGLALGIGMMVDNSIVVLENIFRLKQLGLSKVEAAKQGTQQVSMAIIASTLTTISVFLPIVFLEGVTADIFKELALTVTFSLVSSLLVALTLVPMLASKIMKDEQVEKEEKAMEKVHRTYERILEWALGKRAIIMLIIVVLFAGSMGLATVIGAEYFPSVDQGQIALTVDVPAGSSFDTLLDRIHRVEEVVKKQPEVEMISSSVGTGGVQAMVMGGGGSNSGSLTVILQSLESRQRSDVEIAEDLRTQLKNIPGAKVSVEVTSDTAMSAGAPISIEIAGDELRTLETIANDIVVLASSVDGASEVSSSVSEGQPELQIKLNRIKAAQHGISAAMVSQEVQLAFQGMTATRYKEAGKEYDVNIVWPEGSVEKIQDIQTIRIASPMGYTIALGDIADFTYETGPQSVSRNDQSRVVTVTGQLSGSRTLNEVNVDIQTQVDQYELPNGYSISFGGEQEEMVDAFGNLALALLLGVVLVYMIMASQFESLQYPFIILITLPLSMIGVVLGLFIANVPLSMPAIIGVIVLAGIVVNNGIVLVDYINTLRKEEGYSIRKAIINAAPTRLRPIMMTMLTTILALVPMALGIGEGSELMAPLAVSVIGGLLFSTILTLIAVPVFYSLMAGMKKQERVAALDAE
jgi:HAE1 family hydrophobic/amphiphilic exporter-1